MCACICVCAHVYVCMCIYVYMLFAIYHHLYNNHHIRLNTEACPDELQQMETHFMNNTVQHPMEEHCCLIINTLDEIIVNKLNCASCIRDMIKKISDTHNTHGLFNNNDLYKVNSYSYIQPIQ